MTEGVPAVIRLGGGQLLLRGAALVDTWHLARSGAEVASRRDGIALSPRVRRLLAALEQEAGSVIAAVSADGPTDVRAPVLPGSSPPDDQLTTEEVARMMRCSTRHIRRCAETLGGRRFGGRWVFSRAEVAAYLTDKAA